MSTYEIGAFSEQQLLDLGNNGSNIGYGDTFTMPSSTDTLIIVWDNDNYLSGDSYNNENSNDSYGQNATVTTNGVVQTDGNQIYAESYHWVWGSDGNWYIMIEIEAEGDGQDYFSFYGDVPPEGTVLTVNCGGNVTCDWINYGNLQDPNNITPPLAVEDLLAIGETETGNLNILGNDVDLDGGAITVTDIAGGAVGTPFEVTSPEGYAAMVTVEADGSMTVVPGPMFVMLTDGETTTVSFDYTITDDDGLTSTATVTIEVNGELTLEALDDAIVVSESETAGDIEGNVLDNDSVDGVAYDGEVTAVNDVEANVGAWVEGSNGGRMTIDANGNFDFDAQGDFDSLKDGQSAETTFTYQISEHGTIVPQHNILFVFDVSNSTVGTDGQNGFVGTGVGDVNNDGRADTVLDAQIVAAKAVIQDLIDKGIDPANVNIGLVTFSGVDTSGGSSYNNATVDAATVGTFSLDDANLMSSLDGILSGSWTNYEAGLDEAGNWFDANADEGEENVMYFLSDGRPITGVDQYGNYVEQSAADYADELAGIESYGTSVHAIGVGANASLEALDGIDNTGGAVRVMDAGEMTAEILSSHEYVAAVDTATVTVTVNGVTDYYAISDAISVHEDEAGGDADLLESGEASVLVNDLEETDAYNGAVEGVNGDAANIGAAVVGDNGGLLTINADGTVDFDANGEFDGLRDGEIAVTTFTYEIEDGETATVTVTVNGDTDYTAVNDTMSVSEDETAGDADLLDGGAASVLANDLDEADAYTGDVLGVDGDAANVGIAVAGSNGGLLTINADGSVDFDANGEFDHLRDDEAEVTVFTYEIAEGEMASVTVTVNGDTDYYALDDAMTVTEDEIAGDADLLESGEASVLANDLEETDAYDGDVLAVNGAAAGVAMAVAGDNGGLLTINADGTVDFDANGDFDAMRDGEVETTTFTYEIAEGETASVTVTVLGDTDYTAVNDTMTVTEDETAGDADLLDGGAASVLANDLDEADAYTGDVLAVNGDAANVAMVVAGSNGGKLTINADGTVDFDANGDFDGLRDDEIAQTEFTYQIEDGEMATVVVTVNGDTDYYAVNDTMTVNADEAAGDADVLDGGAASVLANDLDEADAYTGAVLSVNADAANVGAAVAGSNGGMLTIAADGTVDFDANGDFSHLIDGQSDTTTFTYAIEDGKTASVIVTVNGMTVRDANDDLITVFASEGLGDTELTDAGEDTILRNDIQNGAEYMGTVATVNGTVTNVNVLTAGDNGGFAKILADGTIDFDAAGDFDSLLEGEEAFTSFTYTIQGGEEATVTVKVIGETEREAVDDMITVSESETSGDVDGDVLLNDTQEGGAYSGDVLMVEGDAMNVGTAIVGSNGGLLTLNANGSFDFDANDEFDFLNLNQTATTTFTYGIEGGETATLTVNVEGEDDDTGGPTGPAINLAIMMQSDLTMDALGTINPPVALGWADYDGDGNTGPASPYQNEQIDLAFGMIEDFIPEAFAEASLAGITLNISLISFDGDETVVSPYTIVTAGDDVHAKLDAKVAADNSGDFGSAFDNAGLFFDDVANAGDTNAVFFIGNGNQTNSWVTQKADLVADHGVTVDTYYTDFVLDPTDTGLLNLSAMDDQGTADSVFNDATVPGSFPFGTLQEALSITDFI